MKLFSLFVIATAGIVVLASCHNRGGDHNAPEEAGDPPEVGVGERLFLETRFAHFQFANGAGGDPVMDFTVRDGGDLPGPFSGQSMNCRACHLVDEHRDTPGGGVRTYTDFARRSPIPARSDGRTETPRNSPPLVGSAMPGAAFFHLDGEFATMEDLVKATFTGRNFGWLPGERDDAIAHLAAVVREDDGTGDLAQEFEGLPYRVLLRGESKQIPDSLKLPQSLRIDVMEASDEDVFNAVARLVAAYVNSLQFAQDADGVFIGSAFDRFLERNGLPRSPSPGESDLEYGRRLRGLVEGLVSPEFVSDDDGGLALHDHPFAFGPTELQGLRMFLAEPSALPPTPGEVAAGAIGNCIACHAPPGFTDFSFHNVGTAQSEYDGIHGDGAFNALFVPTLTQRDLSPDLYLPPSADRPGGAGPFLAVPTLSNPALTDLGLWNVFANDAVPGPQQGLRAFLGASSPPVDADLDAALARFKTPSLRDLGQSGPYFHNGEKTTLLDVTEHYRDFSERARAAGVRNADPQLVGIALLPGDLEALRAFLRSLDEDYE